MKTALFLNFLSLFLTCKLPQAVAEKKGSVDDFMGEFKDVFGRFVPHRRQYKMQRINFNEHLRTLREGEVAFVVDFQERLQIKEQDQVQSQHWNQDATTIFPCPIYFRWGGRVWSYCFMILSDDMEQDNAWVQYVMTRLMRDDVPTLLRKLGAPPMTVAFIWTDNCAKQFKCKYHWGWVVDARICVADANGESTEGSDKLHIEHHYFGPKHGKNPSDSAGAQAKSFTTMMVKNQGWAYVESSKDLCTKLEKGMGFILHEATSEERADFLASRVGSRTSGGTEQLLMTKVSRWA